MRILIILLERGPMKKTDVYRAVGDKSNKATKLDELEVEGLVRMTTDRYDNNKTTVELTVLGRAIAQKLTDINLIMSGEIVSSDAETDYDPPNEEGNSLSR